MAVPSRWRPRAEWQRQNRLGADIKGRETLYRTISRLQAWTAVLASALFTVGLVDMVTTACRPHVGGAALVGGLVLCLASAALGAYGALEVRTRTAWFLCFALGLLAALMAVSIIVLMLMCGGI